MGVMTHNELKGDIVTLRLLNSDYFQEYLLMFSPKVREMLHAYSANTERDYLQQRLEKVFEGKTLFYCIFDNKTTKLVGAVEIRNEHEAAGQLYIWLNE